MTGPLAGWVRGERRRVPDGARCTGDEERGVGERALFLRVVGAADTATTGPLAGGVRGERRGVPDGARRTGDGARSVGGRALLSLKSNTSVLTSDLERGSEHFLGVNWTRIAK